MKKILGEKKNALIILLISGIGSINFIPGKEYRFLSNFVDDKYILFIVFTSLFYFVTSIVFLFFFKNLAVRKWFIFSLPFILVTVPIYIYIESIKPDFLYGLAMIPNFLIYLVLFIITPFYLKRKSKNT